MTSKEYLQGNIGFMTTYDECTPSLMRIHWLNYCIQKYKNNFHDALNYLYKVEEILEEPDFKDTVISLKNVKHNKLIDYKTVKDLIVKMERKINLISVKKLYDSNNFKELVEILKGSIVYSTEPKVNIDSLPLKIQSQIEVLLESLWRIDNFEVSNFKIISLITKFENSVYSLIRLQTKPYLSVSKRRNRKSCRLHSKSRSE